MLFWLFTFHIKITKDVASFHIAEIAPILHQ